MLHSACKSLRQATLVVAQNSCRLQHRHRIHHGIIASSPSSAMATIIGGARNRNNPSTCNYNNGQQCNAAANVHTSSIVSDAAFTAASSAPPATTTPLTSSNSKFEWNRAFSAAEKIVGYPTTFLSLRWLLSDEIANVAVHLRKLVGSSHPLLKTAKKAAENINFVLHEERNLLNGRHNMQAWGLIVLLLSKTAGQTAGVAPRAAPDTDGVLATQRALAEVTEMIRISHMVHQGLINLQPLAQAGQDLSMHDEMTFGNKIALLSGDYLLGNSCAELAQMRNQQLVELISSAVRDLAEAEFIGDRDEQNNPLPSKPRQQQATTTTTPMFEHIEPGHTDNLKPLDKLSDMGTPEEEWETRHLLNTASLLGKACQGAMILAGQSTALQTTGYEFGKHLALAWQARLDLEPFLSETIAVGTSFGLVSAPVLFHLEFAPQCYEDIQEGRITVENVDYVKLHKQIAGGPALDKTRALLRKHTLRSMKCLNRFPHSEARTALQNIILAMQEA